MHPPGQPYTYSHGGEPHIQRRADRRQAGTAGHFEGLLQGLDPREPRRHLRLQRRVLPAESRRRRRAPVPDDEGRDGQRAEGGRIDAGGGGVWLLAVTFVFSIPRGLGGGGIIAAMVYVRLYYYSRQALSAAAHRGSLGNSRGCSHSSHC